MPIICLLLCFFPQQDSKPLPELKTFLAEARKKKFNVDTVIKFPDLDK